MSDNELNWPPRTNNPISTPLQIVLLHRCQSSAHANILFYSGATIKLNKLPGQFPTMQTRKSILSGFFFGLRPIHSLHERGINTSLTASIKSKHSLCSSGEYICLTIQSSSATSGKWMISIDCKSGPNIDKARQLQLYSAFHTQGN